MNCYSKIKGKGPFIIVRLYTYVLFVAMEAHLLLYSHMVPRGTVVGYPQRKYASTGFGCSKNGLGKQYSIVQLNYCRKWLKLLHCTTETMSKLEFIFQEKIYTSKKENAVFRSIKFSKQA